jgi:hypothetical protein
MEDRTSTIQKFYIFSWAAGQQSENGLTAEKSEEGPKVLPPSRHLSIKPDENGMKIIKEYMSKKGL